MPVKPSWNSYHKLGEQIAVNIEPVRTFAEIGRTLGISKQKAYHECMVALGKVAYQAKKKFGVIQL